MLFGGLIGMFGLCNMGRDLVPGTAERGVRVASCEEALTRAEARRMGSVEGNNFGASNVRGYGCPLRAARRHGLTT